jgi:hypothetical protein
MIASAMRVRQDFLKMIPMSEMHATFPVPPPAGCPNNSMGTHNFIVTVLSSMTHGVMHCSFCGEQHPVSFFEIKKS